MPTGGCPAPSAESAFCCCNRESALGKDREWGGLGAVRKDHLEALSIPPT